jgi:hypothetical protein
MINSDYWKKKVCPSSIDEHATLAIDRGNTPTANYASMVIPASIQAVGMITAGGLIMNGLLNQNVARMTQSVNTLQGSRFSTGFFNSTPAPSWLGQ